MNVQIQPIQVLGKTAVSVSFEAPTVQYGQSATAQYVAFDADGNIACSGNVSTTQEQYSQWGSDDSYVIDCFLTNLGMTRGA